MVSVFGQPLSVILLLVGAALIVGEALAPGANLIVLGIALLVAGMVGIALPPALGAWAPLVMAGVAIAAASVTLYAYREFDIYGTPSGDRTSDSASLRGQTGRVTEEVTETGGEVKLDDGGFDPHYRARAFDGTIPVGTTVIVVDPGGGNVVTVAAMDAAQDDIDRELAAGADDERDTA